MLKNLNYSPPQEAQIGPQSALSSLFHRLSFAGNLTEWGIPHGRFGRIFPLLGMGQTSSRTLWITDQDQMVPYPKLIHNLGLNIQSFDFLKQKNPLKNLKPVFTENVHKKIVLDTSEFLRPRDLNFLARLARQNKGTFFLIRHFFLSPRNGNPFSKNRLNCSFSLSANHFSISVLKGQRPQKLQLTMKEVFR